MPEAVVKLGDPGLVDQVDFVILTPAAQSEHDTARVAMTQRPRPGVTAACSSQLQLSSPDSGGLDSLKLAAGCVCQVCNGVVAAGAGRTTSWDDVAGQQVRGW